MNNKSKYLVFAMLFITGFTANLKAQSDLEISKVFEKYSKQKGSVMVEMTGVMPEGYDFSYYKSIVVSKNKEAGGFMRDCLKTDQKGAKKVKQVVSNGELTTIYLQLPRKDKHHRLILFNEARNPEPKLTLIYIESEKEPEEILKLILKKK